MFQYLNIRKISIFFFKSVQIYIRDAEYAETNEKSIFRFFEKSIFRAMVIFVLKSPQFSMNFHDNSKNKNWKNRKKDFSFISAHFASFMKVGSKLRGEGGSAYPLLGKGQTLNLFLENVLIDIQ